MSTSDEVVVDFTKIIRRKRCAHHYVARINGTELCTLCRDEFPCRGNKCTHLDCIARGIKLKLRPGFPQTFPFAVTMLADKHRGDPDDCPACALGRGRHYAIRVDPSEAPASWVLPASWQVCP